MPFEKGCKRHPLAGKKKGSTHPLTFPKARAEIIASGLKPIAGIIKLLPALEPKDQVKALFELQSWLESKPKEETQASEGMSEEHAAIVAQFENISSDTLTAIIRGEIHLIDGVIKAGSGERL